MKEQIRSCIRVALVGGLLAAGPLAGQTPGGAAKSPTAAGGDMAGMMAMMSGCSMMAAMAQGPEAALARRKALALTEGQVTRLEALRNAERQAMLAPMDSMGVLHRALAELADADRFDEGAVRGLFGRMGTLHTEMGTAMLRARQETLAVLTPPQRQKLADAAASMTRGMSMPGMMGMDMAGSKMAAMMACPMMGGMMADSAKAKPKKP